MLLDTGIRIPELLEIRTDTVDITCGLLAINGKGHKGRVVPFSRWTR